MLLGKLKLTYSLLLFIFFKNLLHAGFYFSVNKDSSVTFIDKNKDPIFNYKRVGEYFYLQHKIKKKEYIEKVFNDGYIFSKSTFRKINKNKFILEKKITIERLKKNKAIHTTNFYKNQNKISKSIVVSLEQKNDSSINILDYIEFVDDQSFVDFQLGICKQEYLLDEDVLLWAEGVLPAIEEVPFNYSNYIDFKNCRNNQICQSDDCTLNKTDFCGAGKEDVFEGVIQEALVDGVNCLMNTNPELSKLIIASLYDQKVNKNKMYEINCTGKNFINGDDNLFGMATTPCHKKFPSISLLTPGCYNGGTKVTTTDFKRNVLHEFLHTLGYVHGVAPEIAYGCGDYCFPKPGEDERSQYLKNICSDNSTNPARDYYSGVITSLYKMNENGMSFSQDRDWALEEYRWRVKDVRENEEEYKNTFPKLKNYSGDKYVDLATGFSLISNYSTMLNSFLFFPANDETNNHLNVAKNLAKMFLSIDDGDLDKIQNQSLTFESDKNKYIVEMNNLVDEIMDKVSRGKENTQKESIYEDFLKFKANSLRRTCLNQYEMGELIGEAQNVCRMPPMGIVFD